MARTIATRGREGGVEKIREASARASASGRTRAMPRDLGEQTDRRFVQHTIRRCIIAKDVSGAVTVTFSADDFAAFAARYGLEG